MDPNEPIDPVARALAEQWWADTCPAGDLLLGPNLTLETLLTDAKLAAFNPSRAQCALVRAADGRPLGDALSPTEMSFHFGCEELPPTRPRLLFLRTGVRAGKSLISSMALLLSILTCQFRRPPAPGETPDADGMIGVRPGELVRALIVAPLLKLSRAPFDHLVGTMLNSPLLSRLLPKEPGAESCVIRRPDGREVTVELVAASSGGANLRSTWLAGVVFDEADFHDDENGAVNLPDNIRAAVPRLLAGAQAWVPSSPWADSGPFHEMFTDAWGKPGRALAFHSDSRSMNPTLSREEEAAERARDPDNAAREFDAIPLSANSSQFFPPEAVDACVDQSRGPMDHLPRVPGVQHYGGSDLGFRKNSSALAIARHRGGKVELCYHEEQRPEKGRALKPSEVCASFGGTCALYGCQSVKGDLHYAETAREELGKKGVGYVDWNPSRASQADLFAVFKRLLVERTLVLPNDPRLLHMIKGTKSRPMPGGEIQIQLPKQGAAHGDVLVAVVLACTEADRHGDGGDIAAAEASLLEWAMGGGDDGGSRYGGQRGY